MPTLIINNIIIRNSNKIKNIITYKKPKNKNNINYFRNNNNKYKSNFNNKIILSSNNCYINNKIKKKSNFISENKISINESLLKLEKNKKNQIQNITKIMNYNNDEKNEMSYNLALIYDKRSYCQYYCSLLRLKHGLIFSFCYCEDYNSKIIKIDLFFIEFTINYAINALFFNDETMHKIYINKGYFDLENQIPLTLYSFLISMIIDIPLAFLALSNDNIINLKQHKIIKNVRYIGKKLIFCLKIKFALYFFLSILLLVFFWYYISLFGIIYKNTQFHLLKDTLISLSFSFIYPFIIYLLPGLCRIPSLSSKKKKRNRLYKFSKLLTIL